ncbi:MAG: hypothetical protein JNK32_04850 [Anaerolineales bacterium]|nr:hypothetical protein [Anaerolineales bacterium]
MSYLKQSIREARDIKADFIALDALVWVGGIHARRGEIEKAVELWGMIRQHPKTDPETIQSLDEVAQDFPLIQEAEEKGRKWELDSLLNEVLK